MVLLMTPEMHNPFVAEGFAAPLLLWDDMVDVRFFCRCKQHSTHGTFALLALQQRQFLF